MQEKIDWEVEVWKGLCQTGCLMILLVGVIGFAQQSLHPPHSVWLEDGTIRFRDYGPAKSSVCAREGRRC